tara:strand:+ start:11856 stop:12119 length:264 start_codon:yes stop_codon:yes gene_type:complete
MFYDVEIGIAILLVGMIIEYKLGILFRIMLTFKVHKMLRESGEFAFNVKERFEFQEQLEESEEPDDLDLSEENKVVIDDWDRGGDYK